MKYLTRSLLGLCVIFAGCATSQAPKNLDTFAQCLTEQGLTMYGAPTCPYCQKQQAMFGESFQYIDYIDCTKENERCANLRGVPARELHDGSIVEGLQSFENLTNISNCPLPEQS